MISRVRVIPITRTTQVSHWPAKTLLGQNVLIVSQHVYRPPSFWYPGGYFAGRRAPISIDGGCGDETTWPN